MDPQQTNNLSEQEQNLNLSEQTTANKPVKTPKVKLISITLGVALVTIVASLTWLVIKKDNNGENSEGLFSGFSKIIISSAYAEDNFSLNAQKSDSLGVEADSSYILKSKEPLETNLIKDSLKIEPSFDYDIKKVSDQEWEIVPKEVIEPNILIKASLTASYITASGEQKESDYSWAFQVKDTFKVINNLPRELGTNVPLNSGIEITFSHDNFVDFDKNFEINPTLAGSFEKHGRTAVFVAKEDMKAGTIYTVTVKNTLGLEGSTETLGQDYSFAFETRTNNPQTSGNSSTAWLSVSNPFMETNSNDAPLIQIYARNISSNKINTSVYKFDNWEKYFASVKQRDKLPWWSYSKELYIEDSSKLNKILSIDLDIEKENNIQFLRFPEKLDKGFYLVELVGPNRTQQIWLQVNDLATYYTITKTDTIVWINNAKLGGPITNAQINIIDSNYNYTTDNKGIARFQMPTDVIKQATDKKENERRYFKISGGDDVLILPASPISYNYSWSAYSNADDYWNYLYTDRPLYQTTDKIQYWGLLRNRDNKNIDTPVTVTLYKNGYVDYYYRPVTISEQSIKISDEGTFSGEIDIANLRPDSYTLQLKIGDKVISTKYVNIKPYVKPAYSLSIVPDKQNAFIDETVNLKVKASFFEGTPVPNLKLKFKMPEGEYQFTTDENGEADLSYQQKYEDCTRSYNCWPKGINLSVFPEDSELAEINASTYVRFYAPNVYIDDKVTYPEAGLARIEIDSKFIDLTAMTNKNWWERNKGTTPAPNTKIEGELTKTTYTKKETGTAYDFINKKSYKTYSYDRQETTEDSFIVYTDTNGHYTYEKRIEPNTSYRLKLKVFDSKGYYDNYYNYLYYYDGNNFRMYNSSNYNYYYLSLPEEKTFDVGEKVEVSFLQNDENMDDRNNGYLYLQLQNGLQDYSIANTNKYSFNFQAEDIPNISLRGIYFNGTSYVTSQAKNIKFNSEKKQLKITITPDKTLYKPGEEALLSFDVRDINNKPVQAEMNVNLVDEAFYAVMDEEATPLSTIYQNVGEGILNTKITHRDMADSASGAEKGCFTAGTEILMADGSKKPIEQIEVGDKIKTFSDFVSQELVSGEVTKVWEHLVSTYYIINEELEVTPEHLVFANGRFMNVGSLKVGDWLLNSQGEKVTVEVIETHHGLTKVYNFEVEPYHTYFAGDFYVHNEKGGGPREFFVDTALFETVKTNSSGKGEIKLTLPDNITSWRVTVQAISNDIKVGVATEKIPVSLPVFAEVTIGNEYLRADQPIARMRAFGTALNSSDKANFFINASSLGVEESDKQSGNAFSNVFFPLPALSNGSHDITYNLESSKGNDSLLLPINVIESRVAAQVAKSEKLTTTTKVTAINDLPFAVILLDQGQNQLYYPLLKLAHGYGSRVDQVLPRQQSYRLLNKYYDRNFINGAFNAFDYQMNTGGITLLPYSSAELELSARVASVGADGFDKESLSQYFYNVLNSQQSNQEEISFALFGLASLDKPVLPRINSWLQNDKLGPKEKLYLSQALLNLGDRYRSKELYLEVMAQYGEVKEPDIKIQVSTNPDEVFHATAIAAVLASSLDAPEAAGLWEFLDKNQKLYGQNKNSENLFTLERLSYIKDAITKLKPSPATIKYKLFGKEKTVDITGGSNHSFQLYPQQVDQLEFLEIVGDVGITSSYTVAIDPANVEVDNDINVRREYYVDGVKTNTFNENDVIEVRLYTSFSTNALAGNYQVTDLLPSGLMPVTKTQTWNSRYDCSFSYPYNSYGQSVKYMINKNWTRGKCSDYIKYYARVRNKGTYVAEPAIIQSFTNPDFINYSTKEVITIQ